MDPITPDQIEAKAKAAGMSINQLCKEAGVARSIFTRWKNGDTSPSVDNVNRLIETLNRASREPSP